MLEDMVRISPKKLEEVRAVGDDVLKVLICCGGGFSSSAMARKVKKDIAEHGLEDKVYCDFQPFALVSEVIDEYDVIMCCPHLQYDVKRYVDEKAPKKPLYLIPPQMYGSLAIRDVMLDAADIIKIYEQTHHNPVHFPGEDNLLMIRRAKAYRRVHKQQV